MKPLSATIASKLNFYYIVYDIGVCFIFIVFMTNLANVEINYQCLSLSLS